MEVVYECSWMHVACQGDTPACGVLAGIGAENSAFHDPRRRFYAEAIAKHSNQAAIRHRFYGYVPRIG